MTSNVLPLHFAHSQASSSQNTNVDDTLVGYKIKSALPYKIFSTLTQYFTLDPFQFIDSLVRFTFIASFFLQFSSGNFSFLFSAGFEPIWQPQKYIYLVCRNRLLRNFIFAKTQCLLLAIFVQKVFETNKNLKK